MDIGHRLARIWLGTFLVCAAAAGGSPARAASPLPADFVGVLSEDVFYRDAQYRAGMLPAQLDSGIRIVRQDFEWWRIEPAQGQYDFSYYDAFVGDLARRGLRVLPVLLAPPPFRSLAPPSDNSGDMYPPRTSRDYAEFAATVARRYGPRGSFWASHPDIAPLPVRSWQIWNEPNLPLFWASGPDAAAYTRMLNAAAASIKQVDSGAEIVAAGLPQSSLEGAVPLLRYAEDMYRSGTPRFDTFAVHAYAPDPASSLALTRQVRALLDSHRDRARIWVTEFGWATGGWPSRFTVDERTQATYLERAIDLYAGAAAQLRLRGLVLFKWRDSHNYAESGYIWPHFAGLLRADGSQKPAYLAFRRAIRRLGLGRHRALASRCGQGRVGAASAAVGVSMGPPIRHTARYRACQAGALAASGIGLVRQRFDGRGRAAWDSWVLQLASHRIRVLPVVEPRRGRSTARLAAGLARRYGPRGALWRGVPARARAPVRAIQVLGHVNRARGPRNYARLLRRVRRRVDHQARGVSLITASLEARSGARFLRSLYRHGGNRGFDAVGVDLGRHSSGQQLSVLRRLRRVITRQHDRSSWLLPTGIGWTSRSTKRASGLRRQARRLRRSLKTLRCRGRALGMRAFVYGRWRDSTGRGRSTGLLDTRGRAKPALRAFRAAAKSCASR